MWRRVGVVLDCQDPLLSKPTGELSTFRASLLAPYEKGLNVLFFGSWRTESRHIRRTPASGTIQEVCWKQLVSSSCRPLLIALELQTEVQASSQTQRLQVGLLVYGILIDVKVMVW